MSSGLRITIRGIVQGVGFRPFVYTQAIKHNLKGWVRNTSAGVEIEVAGEPTALSRFVTAFQTQLPPLARIDSFLSHPIAPDPFSDFQIIDSQPEEGSFIPVSPDMCLCPDCRRELFDPDNRRFHYPFINCTNCGPRFTIIQDIPYDRPKTTMAGFQMCADCAAEYHNPLDRRFHAQPTACPVCGPQLFLLSPSGEVLSERDDALQMARTALRTGKILALKGLGGFHLACDAQNPSAVATLRARKRRSAKPFALMTASQQIIQQYCLVNSAEAALLNSSQHPIVLLQKAPYCNLPEDLTPGQSSLGFMLPYTPLHELLLEPAPDFPEVLVMTSGNFHEEPITFRDEDALEQMSPLADFILTHNRPIQTRVDDSVYRIVNDRPYPIRRARGYAPDPIQMPFTARQILAGGAELKNTFCLLRDQYAFLSHHIGDLENLETLTSFEEGITHFEHLFRIQPELLACDLHPDYLSSRALRQRSIQDQIPILEVQHHHAHLASCLVDNFWQSDQPVIGLCFDGTGYGTDGAVWGGEVLYGGYLGFERLSNLRYTPLPGGDQSVRKPARMALAHLYQAGLDWDINLPPVAEICADERSVILAQMKHHLNTPLTSSMGRLFDAAAALMGIRQQVTFEGQAAIEMEALLDPTEKGQYEPFSFSEKDYDPTPMWHDLLSDLLKGTSKPIMAARFHNSIAQLTVEVALRAAKLTGCRTIALSGGVWQNTVLLNKSTRLLNQNGFTVLVHKQVPSNDGGIALGQAAIAARAQRES